MRRHWTPSPAPTIEVGGTGPRLLLPQLIFMTDAERVPDPAPVIESLPPGSAVILRHYDHPDRVKLIEDVRRQCRKKGFLFLLALAEAPAFRLESDGYHLTEHFCLGLSRIEIARLTGGRPTTAAAHSEASLRRLSALGVDAALLSPVFATASHPEVPPIGPHRFARILERSPLPLYALGGITYEKLSAFSGHRNLAGAAGISLFKEKN